MKVTGQAASDATHRILEHYLTEHALPWEPILTGASRSADYRLKLDSGNITCEVKTILGGKTRQTGGYDPCKPIVRKLQKSRPQLASVGEPTCVILHSQSLWDPLEPAIVASAAFGPGFIEYQPDRSIVDGSPPLLRFCVKKELPVGLHHLANATLSPAINRRISAVALLTSYALCERNLVVWRQLAARQNAGEMIPTGESLRVFESHSATLPNRMRYEGATRVIVLENPHARVLLPHSVFCGDFDQRWGPVGNAYGPVWIGRVLKELRRDGVPFDML